MVLVVVVAVVVVYLSVYLQAWKRSYSARNIKNAAILRDFLNFWIWQRQKRNNSARLPQFLKLTTSKTKQFCETSFKNGKLSAELTASCQCVLRFFHSTCLKYCACHEKVRPGHTKCCTCHAKSSSQNRNQRPDLLTSLMNMSLVLRLPWKMYLCRSSSNVPRLPSFLDMLQNRHLLLTLDMQWCTMPCACHAQRHLNVQKWSEHVLLHFDLEMRFHHNGVHFFDISAPKSDPTLRCFAHFDLEMCFAPRRRALFRHRNFQKWSDVGVFCTFWLGNVLRATTACNFSSLIWPHGSAPAALASLLFEPPDPQIIGKTPCFATFLPFRAPGSSFFWDFYFFDLLSSFLFPLSSLLSPLSSFLFLLSSFFFLLSSFFFLLSSSLLFSDSSHLCFSSVHIVGSLTSKLPLGTVYFTRIIIIIINIYIFLALYLLRVQTPMELFGPYLYNFSYRNRAKERCRPCRPVHSAAWLLPAGDIDVLLREGIISNPCFWW